MTARPTLYSPDVSSMAAIQAISKSRAGYQLTEQLNSTFDYGPGQPMRFAPPLIPAVPSAQWITIMTVDLVQCLQHLVDAFRSTRSLQEMLSLPPSVLKDVVSDNCETSGTVDLARIDLMLPPDGPVQAIESNANCPGGLHFTGTAARRWRDLARETGTMLPAPLPHERPGWLADWFLSLCHKATGEYPSTVALLYDISTNYLEMSELAMTLKERGIGVVEGDPRAITEDGRRAVKLDGVRVRHAYLKLSLPRFAEWRDKLDPLVHSIASGRLFVQNGLRARWVADNKLCLAAISDPRLNDLLPEEICAAVLPAIPWSRAAANLTMSELDTIAADKDGFVLKTPYGTRGQGVTVGCAVDADTWATALKTAVHGNWLVQQCVPTASLSGGPARHDISVGVAGGVVGALARSGIGQRLNVAHGSRLHPVYLHRQSES